MKSYWRGNSSEFWSFYCPHCREERRLPYQPKPGTLRRISQVALTSLVFTLATWKLFSWKGIIFVVPFWTAYELFFRTRLRVALRCSSCGFDPFLYLVDVKRARHEVEEHWKRKFAEKGIPYPEKTLTPPQLER